MKLLNSVWKFFRPWHGDDVVTGIDIVDFTGHDLESPRSLTSRQPIPRKWWSKGFGIHIDNPQNCDSVGQSFKGESAMSKIGEPVPFDAVISSIELPVQPAPLSGRRRLMMRMALALGVIPLLAACHDDDDDNKKPPSDSRLKENVTRIGTTRHGLPFYTFSYRGRPEVYAGVMAQDVLKVMPDAVSLSDNGYYAVDYGKLKLRMMRLH
jgi:hypothetical protein